MSEERFNRLEDKQDETREAVVKLQSEFSHMKDKFDEHTELVREHIIGDNKIIDQLEGIIPDLATMVKDHNIKKEIKNQRKEKWDNFAKLCLDLGKIAGLISIVAGAIAAAFGLK